MSNTMLLWVGYAALALAASATLASLAQRLFTARTYRSLWTEKKKALAIHDWIFNFLGAATGWTALAYLIGIRGRDLLTHAEATDVVIGLLAYAGIVGVLPYLLMTKGFRG